MIQSTLPVFLTSFMRHICIFSAIFIFGKYKEVIKGNNKITELRTILQRESQNS